ncbi:MAG: CHAD domain-containing protein [Candidatus Thiodiazotropha sp. (ex Dulcina madagascariensis)]|nr:CHAD domain-containing protein [Candidatus Thiodiazotropha sp. (ex Dulcina madagascariensis)]
MALQPISYLLPDELDLDRLRKTLAETNALSEDATVKVKQTFYDSFDWRVWQAGGELVYGQGEISDLCWVDRKNHQTLACRAVDAVPGFAGDLAAGPLADRLASVLEMRVLLPKVTIIQQRHTLRILDSEEKTVVRVVLQSNRYASVDGKRKGELDGRLVLKPLKGYESDFVKLRNQLAALKLKPSEQSLYQDALQGIGRKPGDYSSKLNYRLDPDAPADVTARQIMLGLLNTLEANIEGAKVDLDSEFLHDLRVATRRTRSAMSQIKGVFDPLELEPFRRGFGWIGQITGRTRDLDVYLLHYPGYRAALPKAIRDDLDPFHGFLLRHQKEAHAELVKKLNSPHFRKLLKSWRSWLQSLAGKRSQAPNARRATARLADQRIGKRYKRVLKDGLAIGADSPPERLHDLRKQCKKLRYLMEFFHSLYPKPLIRELIKALKVILDNLGEFQDLEVQARSLEDFGDQMLNEGAPVSALMAMGILVGQLLERQEQAREAFVELFAVFSSEANQQAFRKLFGGS